MTIKRKIKTTIKEWLIKNGRFFGQSSTPADLDSFFQNTKPLLTNYELIRAGDDSDGGYLIPNDLEDIDFCFSPGVSAEASFENFLTQRNIPCFLADYSVEAPPFENKLFDFEKKYLGTADSEMFTTLDSWVNRKAPNLQNGILQMDIEGHEYSIIFSTAAETLKKFKIIVIEFHDLDYLFDKFGFNLINLCFEKLLKDFEIVHIHPNNYLTPVCFKNYSIPPLMEFTFHRKDRIKEKFPALNFPHPMDKCNVPGKADVVLPSCWYSTTK
jgi:hypothetical protein